MSKIIHYVKDGEDKAVVTPLENYDAVLEILQKSGAENITPNDYTGPVKIEKVSDYKEIREREERAQALREEAREQEKNRGAVAYGYAPKPTVLEALAPRVAAGAGEGGIVSQAVRGIDDVAGLIPRVAVAGTKWLSGLAGAVARDEKNPVEFMRELAKQKSDPTAFKVDEKTPGFVKSAHSFLEDEATSGLNYVPYGKLTGAIKSIPKVGSALAKGASKAEADAIAKETANFYRSRSLKDLGKLEGAIGTAPRPQALASRTLAGSAGVGATDATLRTARDADDQTTLGDYGLGAILGGAVGAGVHKGAGNLKLRSTQKAAGDMGFTSRHFDSNLAPEVAEALDARLYRNYNPFLSQMGELEKGDKRVIDAYKKLYGRGDKAVAKAEKVLGEKWAPRNQRDLADFQTLAHANLEREFLTKGEQKLYKSSNKKVKKIIDDVIADLPTDGSITPKEMTHFQKEWYAKGYKGGKGLPKAEQDLTKPQQVANKILYDSSRDLNNTLIGGFKNPIDEKSANRLYRFMGAREKAGGINYSAGEVANVRRSNLIRSPFRTLVDNLSKGGIGASQKTYDWSKIMQGGMHPSLRTELATTRAGKLGARLSEGLGDVIAEGATRRLMYAPVILGQAVKDGEEVRAEKSKKEEEKRAERIKKADKWLIKQGLKK